MRGEGGGQGEGEGEGEEGEVGSSLLFFPGDIERGEEGGGGEEGEEGEEGEVGEVGEVGRKSEEEEWPIRALMNFVGPLEEERKGCSVKRVER